MSESVPTGGIATRRKNGFERPWDPLQLVTWAMFPLILTHYFAFLNFLLWDLASKIVITILYGIFAIALAISVHLTCSTDPADDALCQVKTVKSAVDDEEVYCYFCEINVHHTSKHCRFCDKCVYIFDHHCKWLNTCVGGKNYKFFLAVISSALLLTGTNLALSTALMVYSFAYVQHFHDRVDGVLRTFLGSPLSVVAVQAILVVSVAVFLALVAMIVQLFSFHMMLIYRKMSTYEFIVSEQKRLRDREAQKLQKQAEMQQRRRQEDQEIANASSTIAKTNLLVQSGSAQSESALSSGSVSLHNAQNNADTQEALRPGHGTQGLYAVSGDYVSRNRHRGDDALTFGSEVQVSKEDVECPPCVLDSYTTSHPADAYADESKGLEMTEQMVSQDHGYQDV
ncbi:hypothetical protein EON65_02235 [archaeon]|nr:MAG: hypothetical protein EON65_02235 [archaeon]